MKFSNFQILQMTVKQFFIALLLLLQAAGIKAQERADREIFDRYAQTVGRATARDSLLLKTALFFVNTPYVAQTLEVNDTEQLVVNLREMDCATFVDNVFALTRAFARRDAGFDAFSDELRRIRYRNGLIDGYVSRLHYTTDWIYDNEQMGIVSDKTKSIGGRRLPVDVSYMSTHPQAYPLLRNDTAAVCTVRRIEQAISARVHYFIPKAEIDARADGIDTGSMICFVTKMKGLDTSHVGIACRIDDKLTFIHASAVYGRVVVNPESLTEYCASIKNNSGIIIVKLNC
jgi:hypothetical protein